MDGEGRGIKKKKGKLQWNMGGKKRKRKGGKR